LYLIYSKDAKVADRETLGIMHSMGWWKDVQVEILKMQETTS
jgi:hypothetical protein